MSASDELVVDNLARRERDDSSEQRSVLVQEQQRRG
jgi:hypothetical protein